MAKTNTSDSFLMGTENSQDGSKHTVRFGLKVGDWNQMVLSSDEDIQAFAQWVQEAQELMRDIAQQSHAWTTPSTAPSVFSCLGEEMAELEAFPSVRK